MHQSRQMYLYFCFQILDRKSLEQCFSGFDYLAPFLISHTCPLMLFETLKQIKYYD